MPMPLIEWIALNAVNGLGPVRIKHLLEQYDTPEAVFKLPASELRRSGLVPEECIEEILGKSLFSYAEKEAEETGKNGIRILTLSDKEYPPYLREIFAPPPVLYVKGDMTVFSLHAVAVVGTRTPTLYGKNVTPALVKELLQHGLAIISGLASGVDVVAHRAAVENHGRTVAVLGSGIDHPYSNRNPSLNEKIMSTGAIVSEFPLGTSPAPFNFPRRNRIISGLAAGTLVIEGNEKSGALITANYALQQGRDVFAVPGPITSVQSRGTFNLIKQGAIPARSGHEIAATLSLIENPHCRSQGSTPTLPVLLDLLSEPEREIFNRLSGTPKRIDELAGAVGKPVMELFAVLLDLELKGLVRQISGQQFVRLESLTIA
jgi:DNA processing protein